LEILHEQWLDISPGIAESFGGSPEIIWSSNETTPKIGQISISAELVNVHVKLVDELPLPPLPIPVPGKSVMCTDLQKKQATELFEHLIRSGLSRRKALTMMGPLRQEITKYRHTFSVSEARWTVKGLIGKRGLDRPFMAPVKK